MVTGEAPSAFFDLRHLAPGRSTGRPAGTRNSIVVFAELVGPETW
jgi:hypothetical protein